VLNQISSVLKETKMLMGYKIGVAVVLTAGAVIISGAIGSPLPSTDHEAISTADRLTDLENDLVRLSEENDRLTADLNDVVRQCNDLAEAASTGRMNLADTVKKFAKSQALSAVLIKGLSGEASTRDGDGIWNRYAQDLLDRSKESMRQTKVIYNFEMELYQQVFDTTKLNRVEAHYVATITAAIERWFIEKAYWPALDLSDIGADATYFPEGIPTSPVDGHSYTLDPKTHQVR